MKKLFQNGKLWTVLSALIFVATCCVAVYAATSKPSFYGNWGGKTEGSKLTHTEWNDVMAALDEWTVPEGAIMAFTTSSCPTGWNRYEPADDKPLVGATSNIGEVGQYKLSKGTAGLNVLKVLYCVKGDYTYTPPVEPECTRKYKSFNGFDMEVLMEGDGSLYNEIGIDMNGSYSLSCVYDAEIDLNDPLTRKDKCKIKIQENSAFCGIYLYTAANGKWYQINTDEQCKIYEIKNTKKPTKICE